MHIRNINARIFHTESSELSLTEWKDSTGNTINFPRPCVQTALCSLSGEVNIYSPARTDFSVMLCS